MKDQYQCVLYHNDKDIGIHVSSAPFNLRHYFFSKVHEIILYKTAIQE